MPQHDQSARSLSELGPGVGSKVEQIKDESRYLRGQLADELLQESSRFSEEQTHLLKFHGSYQQEDRDQRQSRKAAGEEKAYQFMVRSRIPGGILTADQYLIEDDLAERYANGTLRVTTRQGFQLHGILKGDLRPTIHEINLALLSTLAACGDVNRNVMACPAPHAGPAYTQIEEVANQITARLEPRSHAYHEIWIDGSQVETVELPVVEEHEPIYGPTYLPRKFKIGIALPGDNCVDVYSQDLGLVAYLEEEQLIGFTVLVGGGLGMTHNKPETYPRLGTPLCYVPTSQILEVVETIVLIQRDYGDRQNRKHARLKYLVEERGSAWFLAELEQRLGYRLAEPRALHWHGADDHLGWHSQGDGRWYLGLYVENGRIKDTETLRLRSALRQAISEFRPGLRLTPHQNILLTDLTEEQRAPLDALLASYGVATDPASLGTRRLAMACPALPTCGLALAEAERALPELVSEIEADLQALGLGSEPLSIRMTGCPNGCARPYLGDIGLVGRSKDLYNIHLGGDQNFTRLNTLFAPSVRRHELVATLRPLLGLWQNERQAQESFGDFCQRVGFDYLRSQTLEEAH